MAFPVTLNGRTYTLADFEGTNYVDGLPDAFEDFVTHAGDIYNTTSTSSVAIGTGSKSFTTADSGKPYQAGTPLRIADAAAPETNFMDAIVTSYSGTSLVVDVFGYAGSGTKTSWTINIGGAKTVDGTLAVAQGGTGATTASDARTNLDVYSKADADSRFLNVSGEASNVTMTGDVTIGDTSGDTLTVNATASFSGDLTVDTNTLYVDSTNNRVGIGESAPEDNLHVSVSDAGLAAVNSRSVALFERNADAAITIGSPDANKGIIYFADTISSTDGQISYDHSTQSMSIGTAGGTDRIVVKDNGDVGIGRADPTRRFHARGSEQVVGHFESTSTSRAVVTVSDANTGADSYVGIGAKGDDLELRSGGSTKVTITDDGDVGIGTQGPATIKGGNALQFESTTGTEFIAFRNDAALLDADFIGAYIFGNNDSSGTPNHYGGMWATADDVFGRIKLNFATDRESYENNTPELIIDSDGHLTIPWQNSGTTRIGVARRASNIFTSNSHELIINGADGTTGAQAMAGGDVRIRGGDGVGVAGGNAGDVIIQGGDVGGSGAASTGAGEIRFETGQPTASYRAKFDGSGNFLVGRASNVAGYAHQFQSGSSDVTFNAYRPATGASSSIALFSSDVGGAFSAVCAIRVDGDLENINNAYGALSDERIKSDIVDASSQLDDIMAIKVRSYTLNSTGERHIGVIAQELEEAGLSGLVKESDEANSFGVKNIKSVKYSVLYMKAIKAIQEQQEIIESLTARIEALEAN